METSAAELLTACGTADEIRESAGEESECESTRDPAPV